VRHGFKKAKKKKVFRTADLLIGYFGGGKLGC
jgi:hypothetical protein